MNLKYPFTILLMLTLTNGMCQFGLDQIPTDQIKFKDAVIKIQSLNPIITDSGISFINKVNNTDLDANNFVYCYFVKGYYVSPDSVRLDFNITTEFQNFVRLVT